jgi:hypothetical protein
LIASIARKLEESSPNTVTLFSFWQDQNTIDKTVIVTKNHFVTFICVYFLSYYLELNLTICKVTLFFKIFSIFSSTLFSVAIRTHCPAIAYNVSAAWRRRGLHCRSDGRKTSKSAQTFRRATPPLAPNRLLSAGIFISFPDL